MINWWNKSVYKQRKPIKWVNQRQEEIRVIPATNKKSDKNWQPIVYFLLFQISSVAKDLNDSKWSAWYKVMKWYLDMTTLYKTLIALM